MVSGITGSMHLHMFNRARRWIKRKDVTVKLFNQSKVERNVLAATNAVTHRIAIDQIRWNGPTTVAGSDPAKMSHAGQRLAGNRVPACEVVDHRVQSFRQSFYDIHNIHSRA